MGLNINFRYWFSALTLILVGNGVNAQINPCDFVGKTHNKLLMDVNITMDPHEICRKIADNFSMFQIELTDAEKNYLCYISLNLVGDYANLSERKQIYTNLRINRLQKIYLDYFFNIDENTCSLTEFLHRLYAIENTLNEDTRLSNSEKYIIYSVISVAKYSAIFWTINKQSFFNYPDYTIDSQCIVVNDLSYVPHYLNRSFYEENIFNKTETEYVDTSRRQKRIARRVKRQTERWMKISSKDTLWSNDTLRPATYKWLKADAYGVLAGTIFGLGSWAALQYIFESQENVNSLSYVAGAAIFLAIPPINSAMYAARYRKGKTYEQRLKQYENWNVKP